MARKRQPKKKANSGVWVGSAISVGILLLICLAVFIKTRPGPADRATGEITDENLAKQVLKTTGLPDLGRAPGGSGSLAELQAVLKSSKNVLTTGGFQEDKSKLARDVIAQLHGAVASGIPTNALEADIPPKRFESAEINGDLFALKKAIDIRIEELNGLSQFDEAQGIALSQFELGKQIFEKNTRLRTRQRGLRMMRSALTNMGAVNRARYDDGEIENDRLQALNADIMPWFNAISEVDNSWKSKLKTIDSTKPNVTDLIRVANDDRDLSFRIFAARRLGYAQHERGEPGNQRAIKDALAALQSDSNAQVASAAKAGASIKREEYAELRK